MGTICPKDELNYGMNFLKTDSLTDSDGMVHERLIKVTLKRHAILTTRGICMKIM